MFINISSSEKLKVHFSGIGGTGMVAAARIAVESGFEVRGSDNPLYPPASYMVEDLDVKLYEGYKAENLDWNPDIVVIGNALSRGNEEVETVLKRRLRYTSFPEFLKNAVLFDRKPVVVCGTHGKTTTSNITAYMLKKCGLNPGYFIGGLTNDFEHSSALGNEGSPFVIEGDEYDTAFFDKRSKFFHYIPEIAIVTSVEFDHSDIFADLDEIKKSFNLMMRQIPSNGWVVACADDEGAMSLKDNCYSKFITYGLSDDADWRGEIIESGSEYQGMIVYRMGKRWTQLAVPLSGEHNMRNTLAAVCVAGLLGARPDQIQNSLLDFKGVKRRQEIFLQAKGMNFIDDFGHHPTAIYETIKAIKSRYPNGRLLVAVEPRSNTMVRNIFQKELTEALSQADAVWLGRINRPERFKEDERLDRAKLASDLKKRGINAEFNDDVNSIVKEMLEYGNDGDNVLIFSNGAFDNIYGKFRQECERI